MKPENEELLDEVEELIAIQMELYLRIEVAVMWADRYNEEKFEAILRSEIETGKGFNLAILNEVFANSDYLDNGRFASIVAQYNFLTKIIEEESIAIRSELKRGVNNLKKIRKGYYDASAKRISDMYVKERILIAPDRWLPNMF